jgi:putative membrane protein
MIAMSGKDWWKDFAKGASLGLGMIPGVSAGTMAVIVGIYDKMINALTSFRKKFKESFLILLPIVLGGVIACVFMLWAVKKSYSYAPFAISCCFAGLILGALPTITKELKGQKLGVKDGCLIGAGFVIAAGLGVLSAYAALKWNFSLESYVTNPVWWIYPIMVLAGFIAAIACVIPGISGAMILFILGIYNPIVGLYSLHDSGSMFNNHALIGPGIGMTLCLAIGALLGLILVSKAMKRLLSEKRVGTFEVVLGFVVGSVVSMFVSQNVITSVTVWNVTTAKIWIYQTTPVWEWIVGPLLFIVSLTAFYLLTAKMVRQQEKASQKAVPSKQ